MSEYDAYPDHPLHGMDPAVLECAREVLDQAAEVHDVDPEMADPIADAVVMALVKAGYLSGGRGTTAPMTKNEADDLARSLRLSAQNLRKEAEALESMASWAEASVERQGQAR